MPDRMGETVAFDERVPADRVAANRVAPIGAA
jgi:hypothetical protein